MPALGLGLGFPQFRYRGSAGGAPGEVLSTTYGDTPPAASGFGQATITATEDTDPEGNLIYAAEDLSGLEAQVPWRNFGQSILVPGNTITLSIIIDVNNIVLTGANYFHPFQIYQEDPDNTFNLELNVRVLPGVPTSFNQFTKDPNLTNTPTATDLGGGFYKYAMTTTVGGGYSLGGTTHIVMGRVSDPASGTGIIRMSSAESVIIS